MKYVFSRDRNIASTKGHSLDFKAGVPLHTPADLVREVLDAGGEPADDDAKDETKTQTAKKEAVGEPNDATERLEKIGEAIGLLVADGKRENFTAGGAPHVGALTDLLGWKPDASERDQAWLAFQADANEGKGA